MRGLKLNWRQKRRKIFEARIERFFDIRILSKKGIYDLRWPHRKITQLQKDFEELEEKWRIWRKGRTSSLYVNVEQLQETLEKMLIQMGIIQPVDIKTTKAAGIETKTINVKSDAKISNKTKTKEPVPVLGQKLKILLLKKDK